MLNKLRINIGCGRDYKDGWLNTDISREVKADSYFDIRTDLIQDKGSVIGYDIADEIYISGVLEQIGENEQFIHAMNECHRVLKSRGVMTVVVPNARYAIAHQDPMDIRKFTPETFPYFLTGDKHYDLYGQVYGLKGWSSIKIEENQRHILIVSMIK